MKSGFIVAFLTVVMALAVAPRAQAQLAVTTGDLNVRAGPGVSHARLATLVRGTPVEVFGCTRCGTWCQVMDGPVFGWVSSRFIRQAVAPRSYARVHGHNPFETVVVVSPYSTRTRTVVVVPAYRRAPEYGNRWTGYQVVHPGYHVRQRTVTLPHGYYSNRW